MDLAIKALIFSEASELNMNENDIKQISLVIHGETISRLPAAIVTVGSINTPPASFEFSISKNTLIASNFLERFSKNRYIPGLAIAYEHTGLEIDIQQNYFDNEKIDITISGNYMTPMPDFF